MSKQRPAVPFVLFDDNSSPKGRCFLFSDPDRVLVCEKPEDVPATLDAIEAAQRKGFFAAGFLSYELGYVLEPKLRRLLPKSQSLPLIWMGIFQHRKEMTALQAGRLIGEWKKESRVEELRPSLDYDSYLKDFLRVKDAIFAGDVYQINYTFKYRFRFSGDPLALFGDLRRKQRAAYGCVIATPDFHILSLSPELFVNVAKGKAQSRPMKGTASRKACPEKDALQRQWLRQDEKSRAENLMIVDLIRNDLGRISDIGSVQVNNMFTVETYPTLHQMTSEVTARPRIGVGFKEALKALFPCGSITGAPKIRAMELIQDLEAEPRGVYSGAVGMVSPDGGMDFNVAIRTMSIDHAGNGQMGVGGGIVSDSDGRAEYEECLLKALFLSSPYEPFQLIETFRLEDRSYDLMSRHLARLAASAAFFGFPYSEDEVQSKLEALAKTLGGGMFKVRLLFDEDGVISLESAPLELLPAGAILTYAFSDKPADRTSHFTFHKTTKRRFYDEERELSNCDEVIFLNDLGQITEGSISNVFAECAGSLLTPPVTCGLVAGTLRRMLLDTGRAKEKILKPADLKAAEAVYLGNSVRGLVPAKQFPRV